MLFIRTNAIKIWFQLLYLPLQTNYNKFISKLKQRVDSLTNNLASLIPFSCSAKLWGMLNREKDAKVSERYWQDARKTYELVKVYTVRKEYLTTPYTSICNVVFLRHMKHLEKQILWPFKLHFHIRCWTFMITVRWSADER